MGYIPNIQQNTGFFVPTTNIWDIQKLNEVDVNSQEFKDLLIILYQNINKMAFAVNGRDNGFYYLQELIDNQSWFPIDPTNISQTPRMNYRTTINFGALPNNGLKSVPHNIAVDGDLSWTRIYGAATDPIALRGIPLPFVSVAGNHIQLDVDAVNVNITTIGNYSSYTTSYIVLEYLKS